MRCENTVGISIPGSVLHIDDGAFGNCRGLESVTFANGLKTIGNGAFQYCVSLDGLILPDSVTHIGNDAFEDCDDVVLIVTEGSYAEEYAMDNGIAYIF